MLRVIRLIVSGSMMLVLPFCLILLSGFVQAASPHAKAALEEEPSLAYAPDSVLIRFKYNATPAQKQQARNQVRGNTIRSYNVVSALEHLQVGPGLGVENAIETLQKLPFVSYVEPDYVVRRVTTDPGYSNLWGLENTGQVIGVPGVVDADIDANLAWNVSTGDPNVVVAVIDTGVDYSHADLAANIWFNPDQSAGDSHGYDFYDNDNDPMDEHGHGTHVAGTICAEANNGVGIVGVAWKCKIMALRFLGPFGGYTSDAVLALDYAVSNGAKISNNSWGGGGFSLSLYNAISNAAANGHLFIAAAGNGDENNIGFDTDITAHYPSSYELDNIISVAATDNRDNLAGFSNFGVNSVDVGAPGVYIYSSIPGDSYGWSSGTSMATPHVAGVAALILSTHSDWAYSDIKNRIFNTVRPISALNGKTVTGGVVNAFDALQDPVTQPNGPDGLSAISLSHTEIDLTWTDNSSDEAGFRIERSVDGALSWTEIADTGVDVTAYSDASLQAETTYDYRVYAYNSAGISNYSNVATTTTDPAPSSQEIVASSDIANAGSVQGSYLDTREDGGAVQSITERKSGGRPSSRYSYLQHSWLFNVPVGSATFYLNAWSTELGDGDSFVFSYSLDGNQYIDMLTISGGDTTNNVVYVLPAEVNGSVYIRVTDTDRSAGNLDMDTIYVDHMYLSTEVAVGDPPLTPTGLSANPMEGSIDLLWSDNADNELGYSVERTLAGVDNWLQLITLGANSSAYSDQSVASDTMYEYRVSAYNASGTSAYAGPISVQSLPMDNELTLTATGYIQGWHYVDLSWSDASMLVDIYRNGESVATVSGGAYIDAKIGKGAATYVYSACESGTQNCSSEVVVVF